MDEASRAQTRRGLLGRTLAVAALANVLGATAAWADDDDTATNDDRDDRGDRGRPPAPAPVPRLAADTFGAELCRVAQANGDVGSGSPGTDPLSSGQLRLRRASSGSEDRRAAVSLRGALAGVSYDVAFVPLLGGKSREGLGTIGPTDSRGDLNALTPNALSGADRVGVFILTRHDGNEAGQDEFVTCMGV